MDVAKEMHLCMKLLALVSSDQGDGVTAALKLQERMARQGMGFEALHDYVCTHGSEFAYQAAHFTRLSQRAKFLWHAWKTAQQAQEMTSASLGQRERRFPGVFADERPYGRDPRPDGRPESHRTWVRGHNRKSSQGTVHAVSGYWRHGRPRAAREPWRYDARFDPGEGYEWIDGHERWYCRAGNGRMIHVRGYWRRKPSSSLSQAA